MAHSRLEKIGTLYSRVSGLIRSGAMKLEDRPLWFEVYQSFPPLLPPRFDRPASDAPIKQIFYPEDNIRAVVHKKYGVELPAMHLMGDGRSSLTSKVMSECEAMTETMSVEAAVDVAIERVGPSGRTTKEEPPSSRYVDRTTKEEPPSSRYVGRTTKQEHHSSKHQLIKDIFS